MHEDLMPVKAFQYAFEQSYQDLLMPFRLTHWKITSARWRLLSPINRTLVLSKKNSVYEELASPEQTATGKDVSNPLYGCDGLPKTVRVFQFTLDSRSEKLDWFLLHQGVCYHQSFNYVAAKTGSCCSLMLLLLNPLALRRSF
ncbi:hypothetical protein Tco_1114217 [Tanacetum coccineum]|uniref:Uncharacterized protein n=1 Tax=Tanacetum coccineum TaxID=301880 RepID=A0ABQ5IUJ1_9ASTR